MQHDAQATPSLAIWWGILLVLIAACLFWIAGTRTQLPSSVMTLWSNGPTARRIPRDDWVNVAMIIAAGPPLLLAVAAWLLAKLAPNRIAGWLGYNNPHAFVRGLTEGAQLALMAACGGVLWLTAFHGLILYANSLTPPRFELWPIIIWICAWLAFVAAIVLVKLRQKRRLHAA